MKKSIVPILALTVWGIFGMASCQNVFTTSLAKPFARDPASLVPKVTAKNAANVAAQVENDPDASLEVLEDLSSLVANSSGTKQTELVVLALNVSSSASGVGGALLQKVDPIADLLKDGDFNDDATQDELFAVIDSALSSMDNLSDSASTLEDILNTPGVTVDSIKDTATADEMAMAAIVLLSNSASSGGGVSTYVDTLGTNKTNGTLTASEQLAIDLAEAAAAKYQADGGTGPLADVLDALNLTGA